MVWGLKIIKWRWLNDPKTIENHRVQWSVIKKVVIGNGQRGASKNHWCQWFSREKPLYPKNDHCSPLILRKTHLATLSSSSFRSLIFRSKSGSFLSILSSRDPIILRQSIDIKFKLLRSNLYLNSPFTRFRVWSTSPSMLAAYMRTEWQNASTKVTERSCKIHFSVDQ